MDRAIRIDTNGMSESQRYRYEPIPGAPLRKVTLRKVTLRKDGQWRLVGDQRKVAFGFRDAYHDYSF